MSQFKCYLFGPPRLEKAGEILEISLRKALALFAYLVVTQQPHSRDTLATLLWYDDDQNAARANLRRTLYRLNQVLENDLIVATPESVAYNQQVNLWLDIVAFQQHVNDCLPPQSSHDLSDECLSRLVEASTLYCDDFMAGFNLPNCPVYDEWQFFQRESLSQSLAQVLAQLVYSYQSRNELELAIEYTRRWLALDPLQESVHRQLMQLYVQAGRQSAAIRQYEECVRILDEELDVGPEQETIELYKAIRTRRSLGPEKTIEQQAGLAQAEQGAFADDIALKDASPSQIKTPSLSTSSSHPVAQSPTPPSSLLNPSTPFIGREWELADILHRLREPVCRLLTLVGPGGIGKTRLAIELMGRLVQDGDLSHEFPDGIFFAPLQAVGTPANMIPAIAQTIHCSFQGDASLTEQLLTHLSEKRLLLVLDNFEHLMAPNHSEDGVDLIFEIVNRAPDVKLLVTSRQSLSLQEEWFYPIAGMRYPSAPMSDPMTTQPEEDPYPWADAETYEAVDLFVQSAQRAYTQFALSDEPEQVIRICQLVDGMPLAIELAAAWTRSLSCEEIVQEIEQSLEFLATSLRNVPTRHRSLYALFEQTWQRLSQAEQNTLCKLSVFRGGCTRPAADAVADANAPILKSLVDRALLYYKRESSGSSRYTMHALLRQFAAEKLTGQSSVAAEVEKIYALYFADQLYQLDPYFQDERQSEAYQWIEEEFHNILASWEYVIAKQPIHIVHKFVEGLGNFYVIHNQYDRGVDFLDQAVHRLRAGPITEPQAQMILSKVLTWQSIFYRHQGDFKRAESNLEESILLAQQAEEPEQIVAALGWLAKSAEERQEFECMKELSEQGIAVAQEADLWHFEARLLNHLGSALLGLGQFEQAKIHKEKALQLYYAHKHDFYIDIISGSLATLARDAGEFSESKQRLLDAIAAQDRIGSRHRRYTLYYDLGFMAQALGEYSEAQQYYEQSLALCQEVELETHRAYALSGLGDLARIRGDYTQAKEYLEQSKEGFKKAQHPAALAQSFYWLGLVALAENDDLFAQTYFDKSFILSQQINHPQRIALALKGLGQVAQAQDNFTDARAKFIEALRLVHDKNAKPLALDILVCLAQNSMALGQQSEGLLLFAFVKGQSAATYEVYSLAKERWVSATSTVAEPEMTQATQQAQNATLDGLLRGILAE